VKEGRGSEGGEKRRGAGRERRWERGDAGGEVRRGRGEGWGKRRWEEGRGHAGGAIKREEGEERRRRRRGRRGRSVRREEVREGRGGEVTIRRRQIFSSCIFVKTFLCFQVVTFIFGLRERKEKRGGEGEEGGEGEAWGERRWGRGEEVRLLFVGGRSSVVVSSSRPSSVSNFTSLNGE
jgi:hypothetical protein